MNFYKIVDQNGTRYYKNLKKLCIQEGLKYTSTYYHIRKNGNFKRDDTKIEQCRFEK
jgi:hypothetical protein